MTPPIRLKPYLTSEELKERYQQESDAAQKTRWHALWLLSQGRYNGREVAEFLGCVPSNVSRWARWYNDEGPEGVRDRRKEAPGRPRLIDELSDEQLDELVEALEAGEAPPEAGGGLWTGPKVARWLEQALGREPGSINNKQGWRALRQLGFSLQRPRPRHPDADAEAQQAFKKGALPQN